MKLGFIWSCNSLPFLLIPNFEYQFCLYFVKYFSVLKEVKSSNTFHCYCVYIDFM